MTAFVGRTALGPRETPTSCEGYARFERQFGVRPTVDPMAHAVADFFANGGTRAVVVRLSDSEDGTPYQDEYARSLAALADSRGFNLLCLPPVEPDEVVEAEVLQHALSLCREHRAFLIVDPRPAWLDTVDTANPADWIAELGLSGDATRNAAVFFPHLLKAGPAATGTTVQVPCGAVAGVMSRTDSHEGVWRAPAGPEAEVLGISGLATTVSDARNRLLHRQGINCLRRFSDTTLIWGARTLHAGQRNADEYRYIPVSRLSLFIQQSVENGLDWIATESGGESLWRQVRTVVEAFLDELFQRGAFQGARASQAYFVQCDRATMTDDDLEQGYLNLLIGFAPLRPAEFMVTELRLPCAPAN